MFRIIAASLATAVVAQDPAGGWLGYAQALPPIQGTRLTYAAAKWKVLSNPRTSNSFFSPWYGIDASDNLNLLQPVFVGDIRADTCTTAAPQLLTNSATPCNS